MKDRRRPVKFPSCIYYEVTLVVKSAPRYKPGINEFVAVSRLIRHFAHSRI